MCPLLLSDISDWQDFYNLVRCVFIMQFLYKYLDDVDHFNCTATTEMLNISMETVIVLYFVCVLWNYVKS